MDIKQLAKAAIVDETTILRVERGDRGCRIRVLIQLCRALNCSADWLLGLSNNGPAENERDLDDGWLP